MIHCYTTKYGYEREANLWKFLRLSAQNCGIEIHGYGGSRVPNYYTMRILDMAAYLERVTSKYVLYCDSRDSLMVYHDPVTAIGLLDYYGKPVLVQAERNCFPYPELASQFPDPGTPWKYVNGGGIFGERVAILECLEKIKGLHAVSGRRDEDASDQGLWSYLYLGGGNLALDTECRLFQSFYLNEAGDCYAESGRVRNKYFPEAEPSILHFNGNTPGIRDWYKKIHV